MPMKASLPAPDRCQRVRTSCNPSAPADADPFADLSAYELRHVVEHLGLVGRAVEIHRLLRLECRRDALGTTTSTAEPSDNALVQQEDGRRNAFFVARQRMGDTEGYLADLRRAWRLAEQAATDCVRHKGRATHVDLEVRYALAHSSVRSLAANPLPELLASLVETGVIEPTEGLALATRGLRIAQKAEGLSALIPTLPECLLTAAFKEAKAIESPYERADVLSVLASRTRSGGRIAAVREAL